MMPINRQKIIKYSMIFLSLLLLLYVVLATFLFFTYRNVFNKYATIGGIDVSGLTIEQAVNIINNNLTDTNVTLLSDEQSTLSGKASDFGITIDAQSLGESLKKQAIHRSLLIFWANKNIDYKITVNNEQLSDKLSNIDLPRGYTKPINAQYDIDANQKIIVTSDAKGYGPPEQLVANNLSQHFSNNISEYSSYVPLTEFTPRLSTQKLSDNIDQVENLKNLTFTLKDEQKSYNIPLNQIIKYLSLNYSDKVYLPEEKAKYVIESFATNNINTNPTNSATYVFSDGTTKSLIDGQNGKKVANTQQLATELSKAVGENRDLNADLSYEDSKYVNSDILIALDKKIYNYKVLTWGSVSASLNEFRINSAETLNSTLGWSRAGISFIEDDTNFDFVLVLSSPQELVSRYPVTCDEFYSCQVANYVIINDERWRKATPVWTKSIRQYQHLVINHETGHWLGLGHYSCTTPGSPAPAMQQQSINLGFCTFNEWPLDYEIAKL